ncbi:MAG: CHASE sensor domain-containing protein [Sulfuricurvum sp.]
MIKKRSIKDKLAFLLSLSAMLAILLSSVALFFYTIENKKTQSINSLVQLTEIVAQNLTAPIEFDDTVSSEKILSSLKLNSNITNAFIFKAQSELFASYARSSSGVTNDQIETLFKQKGFENKFAHSGTTHIISAVPIYFDGELLASLVIASDTKEITKTIKDQLLAQSMVAVVVLLIIIFVAYRLQKIFTLPIFRLKGVMEEISSRNDYSLQIADTRDDEFGDLYGGFNQMIKTIDEKNSELSIFAEKISTLLNNTGEGFLTIDRSLVIDSEYSKECITLLGEQIAGKDISTILFSSNQKRDLFREAINDALDQEDEALQECIISLLPSEVELNSLVLKIEYRVLDNKRVMLIISNITTQKELEHRIKEEQEALKMIVEIVSDSEIFFDLKREYEAFMKNSSKLVDTALDANTNLNNIYREVHTFKGTFSQLYMQNMVNFLHNLESRLSHLIYNNITSNKEIIDIIADHDFKKPFVREMRRIEEILGSEFLEDANYIKIDSNYLGELQDKILSFLTSTDQKVVPYRDIFSKILHLTRVRLVSQLRPYATMSEQLATRLDKSIYPLIIEGDETLYVSQDLKPFLKSLVHIFRNSIDHGIEEAQTRLEAGKDEIGRISCKFEKLGSSLIIEIADDGAGIDKQKVITKALQNGIVFEEDLSNLSDSDIFALIFRDHLSTKDVTSDISGRGVGLSATRAELDAIGGKMQVKSTLGVGSTFTFILQCKEL